MDRQVPGQATRYNENDRKIEEQEDAEMKAALNTYTKRKLQQAMSSRPAAAACMAAARMQLDAGRVHEGANALPAAAETGVAREWVGAGA